MPNVINNRDVDKFIASVASTHGDNTELNVAEHIDTIHNKAMLIPEGITWFGKTLRKEILNHHYTTEPHGEYVSVFTLLGMRSKMSHVRDWFVSLKQFKRQSEIADKHKTNFTQYTNKLIRGLPSYSLEEAYIAANNWYAEERRLVNLTREEFEHEQRKGKTVFKFDDGLEWQFLHNGMSKDFEGDYMHNCIRGHMHRTLYSLRRTEDSRPFVSLSVNNGNITEIKGRFNDPVPIEYKGHVDVFKLILNRWRINGASTFARFDPPAVANTSMSVEDALSFFADMGTEDKHVAREEEPKSVTEPAPKKIEKPTGIIFDGKKDDIGVLKKILKKHQFEPAESITIRNASLVEERIVINARHVHLENCSGGKVFFTLWVEKGTVDWCEFYGFPVMATPRGVRKVRYSNKNDTSHAQQCQYDKEARDQRHTTPIPECNHYLVG